MSTEVLSNRVSFSSKDAKNMTLQQLAQHMRIPPFRQPYATFKRVDATQSEDWNSVTKQVETVHIFAAGKAITLRQEIQVYFDDSPDYPEMVTIQVDDTSRPKINKDGIQEGFYPLMYQLAQMNGDFKSSSPYFRVYDANIYYYLMMCEYNVANATHNKRRRPNSPIAPCIEVYNQAKEHENRMSTEALRRKAEGAPYLLDEVGTIALMRRYGKSEKDPRSHENILHESMQLILSMMASPQTDLPKDKVSYDKIIRDCLKENIEVMRYILEAENKRMIAYIPQTKTWHVGSVLRDSFQKGHPIGTYGEQFGHTDKYDAIMDHLVANPEDFQYVTSAGQFVGRTELVDGIAKDVTIAQSGASIYVGMDDPRIDGLRKILTDHGIRFHHKYGHAKLLMTCAEHNLTVPQELR